MVLHLTYWPARRRRCTFPWPFGGRRLWWHCTNTVRAYIQSILPKQRRARWGKKAVVKGKAWVFWYRMYGESTLFFMQIVIVYYSFRSSMCIGKFRIMSMVGGRTLQDNGAGTCGSNQKANHPMVEYAVVGQRQFRLSIFVPHLELASGWNQLLQTTSLHAKHLLECFHHVLDVVAIVHRSESLREPAFWSM